MNDRVLAIWTEIVNVAETNSQTTWTIAAICVVLVGFLCLRGNAIER